MSDSGRPEQDGTDGGVPTPGRPASRWCRWSQRTEWTQAPSQPSRPASTFVAQLLATAEQAPQTRGLRRATAADAQTAYSASRHQARAAGIRTRQII